MARSLLERGPGVVVLEVGLILLHLGLLSFIAAGISSNVVLTGALVVLVVFLHRLHWDARPPRPTAVMA